MRNDAYTQRSQLTNAVLDLVDSLTALAQYETPSHLTWWVAFVKEYIAAGITLQDLQNGVTIVEGQVNSHNAIQLMHMTLCNMTSVMILSVQHQP